MAHTSIIREGSVDWNRRIKLEVEITRESHKQWNSGASERLKKLKEQPDATSMSNSYYATRQNNSLAPIQNGCPEHLGDHDVLVLRPMPDNFRQPLTYYSDVLRLRSMPDNFRTPATNPVNKRLARRGRTSRDSEAQSASESNLKNLSNQHENLQFGTDGACHLEDVEVVPENDEDVCSLDHEN
ncbi:hypothetical protein FOMA001_g17885 [Fusarium oxysporum f. sp. matthiolae]|nr:hypothetical protein FOMA001_g17885 [Fusarium oxysporum f. sp. matthiolae]